MTRKSVIILIFVILLTTMACTIGYEGVSIGDDPEIEKIEMQTEEANKIQELTSKSEAPTSEPEYQPPSSLQGSEAASTVVGTHEYAVTATNFDCTCQVDGNVTASFSFKGDQLEFTGPGGGVDVYDKIEENKYKRTFMGYYILDSGSGSQVTSTVVEEEKHTVIILNDGGYIMEHYSGSTASPCCYHTHTLSK